MMGCGCSGKPLQSGEGRCDSFVARMRGVSRTDLTREFFFFFHDVGWSLDHKGHWDLNDDCVQLQAVHDGSRVQYITVQYSEVLE